MSMTGIILAALIVGGTGLFIGVFLGVSGKKFAVDVDEREEAVLEALGVLAEQGVEREWMKEQGRLWVRFREITLAAAAMQAVPDLQQRWLMEKLKWEAALCAALLWLRRLGRSWGWVLPQRSE